MKTSQAELSSHNAKLGHRVLNPISRPQIPSRVSLSSLCIVTHCTVPRWKKAEGIQTSQSSLGLWGSFPGACGQCH